MRELQIWIYATRPKTWIASLSPVLIGTIYSWREGFFSPLPFLLTLISALGIQIGTNLINDWGDYVKGVDTPRRKGPLRVMQMGWVEQGEMRRAIIVTCFLTACATSYLIFLGGLPIALLSSLSFLLSFAYTVGPFPLSYLGWSEPIAFLFFGPLATASTYYLQCGEWSVEASLLGIAPGAFSVALLALNNLRDVEEDRRGGKHTLCVRFGTHFAQLEYAGALLVGILSSLLWESSLSLFLLIPASLLIHLVRAGEFSKAFTGTGGLFWLYTLRVILS